MLRALAIPLVLFALGACRSATVSMSSDDYWVQLGDPEVELRDGVPHLAPIKVRSKTSEALNVRLRLFDDPDRDLELGDAEPFYTEEMVLRWRGEQTEFDVVELPGDVERPVVELRLTAESWAEPAWLKRSL